MPRVTDLFSVCARLDLDRAWSAYAIGDLSPEFAADCSWHVSDDDPQALVLLYRGFDPPILFAIGAGTHLAPLFREIDAPRVSLHLRAEAVAALVTAYRLRHSIAMWRMVVDPSSFRPANTEGTVPLDETDLDAVAALYDDGGQHQERPTFFQPWMLGQGTFHGIWDGADLVAVAGTHLFSRELGVCALGNVYTRRD